MNKRSPVFHDLLVALEELDWLVATTLHTHCIYKTKKGYRVSGYNYMPMDRVIAVLNPRNVVGATGINKNRGKKKTHHRVNKN